jgi:hypothetical protein
MNFMKEAQKETFESDFDSLLLGVLRRKRVTRGGLVMVEKKNYLDGNLMKLFCLSIEKILPRKSFS